MAQGVFKQFDYYYGKEADSFHFIQVPRFLFTNPDFRSLKSDSKILYSLMLDRMSLSRKNEWFDEENRVFIIFTLEEMMESIGCGHSKCVELLKELSSFGLIERKKRGLGKPDIIYVKDFLHELTEPANAEDSTDFRKPELKTSENEEEVRNSEVLNSENRKSGLPQNGNAVFRESEASNNKENQTNMNQTIERSLSVQQPKIKSPGGNKTEGRANERGKKRRWQSYDFEALQRFIDEQV